MCKLVSYTHTHTHTHTCVIPEGFEAESFPLKNQHPTFEYKIHSNLLTNNAELKTKCNTLSVTKECGRIPGEGLWTNSSKFL